MVLVRVLFWRCRFRSRRDRVLGWAFGRAWDWDRPGRRFRIAVMRLGAEKNS